MADATVTTAIIGAIVALVVSVAWPYYLNRAKQRSQRSTVQIIDSAKVAEMLERDRDRLQTRLDTITTQHENQITALRNDYETQLAAVEAKWTRIHEQDLATIARMQNEIDALYRRLVLRDQPPDPKLG